MTREQLIDAIWDNEDAWSCPNYNCDEPEEEGNTGECCKKCAENLLVEYDKQIIANAIEEFYNRLNRNKSYMNKVDNPWYYVEMAYREMKGIV